ncbi:hypothetical protein V8E54_005006 [Elaphomyces granulatus]
MKASIISTIVATLLAASSAAPVDSSRQFEVSVTFYDPNEHFITQYFPADGNKYPINNGLFVENIASQGGATCTFYETNGNTTTVVGSETVGLTPPQTLASGACEAF